MRWWRRYARRWTRRKGTPGRANGRAVHYIETVDKKLNKNAVRAGVVTAGMTLMLLMSSPAFANTRDDGDDPGQGLSVVQTLGLYVVCPIVLFLIIAGLVIMTDKSRKQRG